MARNFNGSSDYLTGTVGALAGMDAGPITIAAIIKLDANTPGSSIIYAGSGSESGVDLGIYDGLFYLGSQEPSLATASTADGWHLVAANKAAGTATPRWHKYVISSDTWTHTNAGGTMGDGVTVGGGDTLQIGRWGTASTRFVGSIAIAGVWDRVLADAEIELLPFSLQAWHASAPKACILLDQATATTSIVDLTGGGANITGGSGTTVATDSVPVFTYGFETLIPHSVTASGTDATPEPAAISVTTSVGAPSISTGSTTSPSAIAATTSVPSPTPSTGSTATPAAISAVASVPGPSISTGSTVSPAAIAAATTVPAPTPSASATATPTAIAATASLGAPALSVGITLVPAAIAAVVTFPATNVFTGTIVRTVWRAGPPESKWAAGPPQSKWSAGRMPVEVFRATSTETIRSGAITADSAGAAVDPTGFTVTMAYTSTNTAPAAASSAWKAATWDTNSTTTPAIYRAQAAIGPSGVQELSPGTHYLFVKIAASGETPIIPSGAFKVVP